MNPQPRVIVFSTPTCSWCRAVKQHLKKYKIKFREIDISHDENAARDMIRRTGQRGVPVTLINNRPIVGFKKAEMNRLLKIREV